MRLQTTGKQCSMATRLTLMLVTLSAIACSALHPTPSRPTGRAFTEAEVLFHRDPRWLGADAALSVPLGDGRTVWLFGDTFIAKSNAHVRSESEMVRNTVAIQTGRIRAPRRLRSTGDRTVMVRQHRSFRSAGSAGIGPGTEFGSTKGRWSSSYTRSWRHRARVLALRPRATPSL